MESSLAPRARFFSPLPAGTAKKKPEQRVRLGRSPLLQSEAVRRGTLICSKGKGALVGGRPQPGQDAVTSSHHCELEWNREGGTANIQRKP